MSLHAQLSPEALLLLRKQERKSRILSAVIACLTIVLIAGILQLFAISAIFQEADTIVVYAAEAPPEQDVDEKKTVQRQQRKPAAPASNMAKVIAAPTASATAIPVPDVAVADPSMHLGDDVDFGQGWADEVGELGAPAGGFGSTDKNVGGLEGFLFDLKQNAQGERRSPNYTRDLLAVQRSGFASKDLREFFQNPLPLYLTRFAVADIDARKGPEVFQAQDRVQPSEWFAHYRGQVVAPRNGKFRFVGAADDYLYVSVNGKAVLHAHFPNIRSQLAVDWKMPKQPSYGKSRREFIYGDWLELRKGEILNLDIGIGEKPGGSFWIILNIEEEGVEYKKGPDGRPILPLFTTRLLLEECVKELQASFKHDKFEFDIEKVPVFEMAR